MATFNNAPSLCSYTNYKKVAAQCTKTLKFIKRSWKKFYTSLDRNTFTSQIWRFIKSFKKRDLKDNLLANRSHYFLFCHYYLFCVGRVLQSVKCLIEELNNTGIPIYIRRFIGNLF